MRELLEMMDILSASGHESAIRDYLMKKIKPHYKDVQADKFGNLIVHKKGKGPSVMLVAHMDEIGLMVKNVSDRGVIKISMIGGIEPLACVNQRVVIPTKTGKPIRGIITTIPLSDGEEIEELPKAEDLVVDTGLEKDELKKLGVDVGTFLEFEQKSQYLGSNNFVSGKALDDRIGCFILLELIKNCKKCTTDIYYVFTVQEEIGLYGAKTSIYKLEPEWALVLDVTDADDLYEHEHTVTKALGAGPVLTLKDADLISNACLNDNIRATARKRNISIQLEVSDVGTTDALNISLSKGGVPTTVFGVAVRNMHTGVGIVHRKDIESAIIVITDLVKSPPKICL